MGIWGGRGAGAKHRWTLVAFCGLLGRGKVGTGDICNGKVWHNKSVPNGILRSKAIFLNVIFSPLGVSNHPEAVRNNSSQLKAHRK